MNSIRFLSGIRLGELFCICALGGSAQAQTAWHAVDGPLMTRWAKEVSPTNARPEYPRPQLVREKWLNLNGLWEYAIQRTTVPDASGQKNDANVNGAPVIRPRGRSRRDQRLFSRWREGQPAVPWRPVADDFTISLWVKTTQAGAEGSWVGGIGLVDGECPGVTDDFGTAVVGNSFAFGVGNPDTTILSKTPVNDGQWHHVAAVRTRRHGRHAGVRGWTAGSDRHRLDPLADTARAIEHRRHRHGRASPQRQSWPMCACSPGRSPRPRWPR